MSEGRKGRKGRKGMGRKENKRIRIMERCEWSRPTGQLRKRGKGEMERSGERKRSEKNVFILTSISLSGENPPNCRYCDKNLNYGGPMPSYDGARHGAKLAARETRTSQGSTFIIPTWDR